MYAISNELSPLPKFRKIIGIIKHSRWSFVNGQSHFTYPFWHTITLQHGKNFIEHGQIVRPQTTMTSTTLNPLPPRIEKHLIGTHCLLCVLCNIRNFAIKIKGDYLSL